MIENFTQVLLYYWYTVQGALERSLCSNLTFSHKRTHMKLFQYFELISDIFYFDLKKVFNSQASPISCNSIFAENGLEWIHALVAVFWTNIEMYPYDSKRVLKWRYLVDFFYISQKQHFFLIGQINGSKSCFVLCQLLNYLE